LRNQPDTSIVCSTTVLLLAEVRQDLARMTRWSAITRTRRSCSALAYRSHSTAAAEKSSTGSYTTSGDATEDPRSRRHRHNIANPQVERTPARL
jgi:hypothetical protein